MLSRPQLTDPYRLFLDELQRDRYETHTVHDFYVKNKKCSGSVNVIFRVDVDLALTPADNFTDEVAERNLDASVYFLTDEERHYDIWSSAIPRRVADRGLEVGLHTDHYYTQLINGEGALAGIRRDVERLSNHIGEDVLGMVFHGHNAINSLGRRNWDPYKHLLPEELGLAYHDGYTCEYADSNEDLFVPQADHALTDCIGHNNAWQRYPKLPCVRLRGATAGESVHVVVHPSHAYDETPEPLRGLAAMRPLIRVHRYRIWNLFQRFE